ncbi:hypothetical protein KSS87_004541, partial [Heliosperma pusillum]
LSRTPRSATTPSGSTVIKTYNPSCTIPAAPQSKAYTELGNFINERQCTNLMVDLIKILCHEN